MVTYYGNKLYHHGIKGQKWGVRRFQNEDGSYTATGRERRKRTRYMNWTDPRRHSKEFYKNTSRKQIVGEHLYNGAVISGIAALNAFSAVLNHDPKLLKLDAIMFGSIFALNAAHLPADLLLKRKYSREK